MFDPLSDLQDSEPQKAPTEPKPATSGGGSGGGGNYAQDLHSISIRGRQRTFYIDLKQSGHGKFFKVSEKSRGGRKSTIMFDEEDLDQFIDAFQEMKGQLS